MRLVSVRLLGLPVSLHERAVRHNEEVKRELELMALDGGSAPARLLAVATELRHRFLNCLKPADATLEFALDGGEEFVDLHYEVPAEVGRAAAELGAILDEIDEHSREGRLLVLATPPDALTYRRWFFGEFAAQTAGAPPTPWNQAQLVRQDHGGGT